MVRSSLRTLAALVLLSGLLFARDQKPSTKEGWLQIQSAHFTILTDAGEKRGREVAVRLEQMRAVFAGLIMRDKLRMPVPLEVVALKDDKDYERLSPLRKRTAITDPGFFLAGDDKNIIALDLFADEPWRAIAHPFAHMLLDGNYPPTKAWFDEGLAEYFASVRVDNKYVDIGSDPELTNKYAEDLLGNINDVRHPAKSLTELLMGPLWLDMPDFLQMRLNSQPYHEGTHHTLFYAQSWIVVHYLLAKNLLPQAGTYFNLVENEKSPVPQALRQAFGMTPEQFEKAIKDYFQSLTALFTAQQNADAAVQNSRDVDEARNSGQQVNHFASPLTPDEVSAVVKKVTDDDAHALVAEVMVRQPEHREEGFKQLEALAQDPTDNALAHRALAFAFLQGGDFKQATAQLQAAKDDDPSSSDPWIHYCEALLRFRMAQNSGQAIEGGLANVQQDLRAVVDWDPEFAEAYHLLGLAEVQGGGTHAAADSMRKAIELSPRNRRYVLDLADIYLAQKNWDQAQALLEQLKAGGNPQIAAAARKKLDDLPFIKKYGITPDRAADAQKTRVIEANSGISNPLPDDDADAKPQLKERAPDKRPVKYLKGRIVKVDCTKAPEALITISSAGRVLKLHTLDYKSLVLVGADQFSCGWHNQAASVNYKAASASEGDLVSLEID